MNHAIWGNSYLQIQVIFQRRDFWGHPSVDWFMVFIISASCSCSSGFFSAESFTIIFLVKLIIWGCFCWEILCISSRFEISSCFEDTVFAASFCAEVWVFIPGTLVVIPDCRFRPDGSRLVIVARRSYQSLFQILSNHWMAAASQHKASLAFLLLLLVAFGIIWLRNFSSFDHAVILSGWGQNWAR